MNINVVIAAIIGFISAIIALWLYDIFGGKDD